MKRGSVKCFLIVLAAAAASGYLLTENDVIFHLYSRSNPTVSQPLQASVSSIIFSSFSMSRKTVITIHNYGEGFPGNFNAFVGNAHLSAEDINLIAVDWSRGCSVYSQGLANVPLCGRTIATFVNILVHQFGYHPKFIRIVGAGLGGHVAGIAARNVHAEIPHIIALDPSLVGWTHHPEILNSDDASIVEVLHTTAGNIGYDFPLGDIDFYANGGRSQRGCLTNTTCSHILSFVFYAESIEAEDRGGNRFVGTACNTYEDALNLSCDGDEDATFGGKDTKHFGSGIYTFETNIMPPYARG